MALRPVLARPAPLPPPHLLPNTRLPLPPPPALPLPVTGNDDAGNPLGVKRQFGLSGFQLGLLPALYTAGLCVASLAFAELAKHWNGFRLIGVGMALWAAGCVLTGAAQAYGMLVVARVVVGCGERGPGYDRDGNNGMGLGVTLWAASCRTR